MVEQKIPFNQQEQTSYGNYSITDRIKDSFQNYYNRISNMPWSERLSETLFWLGVASTAWNLLVFCCNCTLTRFILSVIISTIKRLILFLCSLFKSSPSTRLNKNVVTPMFYMGDNVHGWLSVFERRNTGASEYEKRGLILELMSPDVMEKLDNFLLNELPDSSYLAIRKSLIRLFSKHESTHDPIMSLVNRSQTNEENLFQYIGALKKLAREAFEHDMVSKEDIIKDQFIRGIKDERIKDKLCNKFGQPLNEIMELASEWESKKTWFILGKRTQ
ncbi:unnamed protein product [Brachionus calyciflorus]|uniref:Uncharacterized protein n=1 Tax=Brachionus calyciflorus TaxID=104777 RepID=A0A813TYV4_9BILA|nr:unnamed protein product [Brachionus calyciflorus]